MQFKLELHRESQPSQNVWAASFVGFHAAPAHNSQRSRGECDTRCANTDFTMSLIEAVLLDALEARRELEGAA